MKKWNQKLLVALISSMALFPSLVSGLTIENPLRHDSFEELILAIANIIFNFAIIVAPIMIIIAGFYFVTAAGKDAQIITAKKIIFWTLVGLLIVFLSRGIIGLFIEVAKVKTP